MKNNIKSIAKKEKTEYTVIVVYCRSNIHNLKFKGTEGGIVMDRELQYSVLIPVYCKELPEYLRVSVDSMLSQTIPPTEIIIVEDGVLPEHLENIVKDFEHRESKVHVIRFPKHQGLGTVLHEGVLECRCDYIARMDSDDISEPDRIEKEWRIIQNNPDISMVGCIYDEFLIEGVMGPIRTLPETPEEIERFAHKRNPFGHSSLLIEKRAILEAGNYRDYLGVEDYDLWIRMLMNHEKCFNIQETLVHVRAGRDFYNRRGGVTYFAHLLKFFTEYKKAGFFTLSEYIYTVSVRAVVCLLPGAVRNTIYKRFLRHNVTETPKITPILEGVEHVILQSDGTDLNVGNMKVSM